MPFQTCVTMFGAVWVCETSVRVATVLLIVPATTTGKLNVNVTLVVPVDVTTHVTAVAAGN